MELVLPPKKNIQASEGFVNGPVKQYMVDSV